MTIRLPTACVVVLVGPSGSGKSTWAESQFRPEQVVSSDRLRALVGEGPHDQKAGKDAFQVLDLVLERRVSRRLLTVVDTLGLDAARRTAYLRLARQHGMACHAVLFDTPAALCRERNRARDRPVPAKVLAEQIRAHGNTRAALAGGDSTQSTTPAPSSSCPPRCSPHRLPLADRRTTRCPCGSDCRCPASPGPATCAMAWPRSPSTPRRPGSAASG
ncbi:MAG: AAA family ATPase [Geodermatophilaceae bacterium]